MFMAIKFKKLKQKATITLTKITKILFLVTTITYAADNGQKIIVYLV